jgi:hypothetical protein
MAFCFMQIPDFRTNFNSKAAPKPWIFEIRCRKLAVSIKVTATWLGTLHPHQRLSRHPLRKYQNELSHLGAFLYAAARLPPSRTIDRELAGAPNPLRSPAWRCSWLARRRRMTTPVRSPVADREVDLRDASSLRS